MNINIEFLLVSGKSPPSDVITLLYRYLVNYRSFRGSDYRLEYTQLMMLHILKLSETSFAVQYELLVNSQKRFTH